MLNSRSKHIHSTNISSLQANSPLLRKDNKNDNHNAETCIRRSLTDHVLYALYQLEDSCIRLSLTDSFLSEVQYVNNK
jgi:hypothetical protein